MSARPRQEDEYALFSKCYDLLLDPCLNPLRNGVSRIILEQEWRRVLDVGGGTGRQCELLAKVGVGCVLVDASPAMLEVARRGRRSPIFLLQGDARRLPFRDRLPEQGHGAASFDAACFSLCLHEMPQPVRLQALAEARRVARAVVIADYSMADYSMADVESWRAGFMRWGAHLPERLAGARHYRMFKDFLARGATEALLKDAGWRIQERRPLFGGAMAIIRAE